MGLSTVVITYNEEHRLERCLQSVAFADEIVVLDSFSTDRTLEIARSFTDKVACRQFTGYSDQRRAALEMVTQDWVFMIDSDEVASTQLAQEIKEAVAAGKYNAYRMPRASFFLGKRIRGCGWYPDYQLRLMKKSELSIPDRLVHESLVVSCEVGKLKGDLLHYSVDTMDDYARKMVSYSRAAAMQMLVEGRRFKLRDFLVRPGFRFFRSYVLKKGFRDGIRGLILSTLTACSTALRYAILWDLCRREAQGEEFKNAK